MSSAGEIGVCWGLRLPQLQPEGSGPWGSIVSRKWWKRRAVVCCITPALFPMTSHLLPGMHLHMACLRLHGEMCHVSNTIIPAQ